MSSARNKKKQVIEDKKNNDLSDNKQSDIYEETEKIILANNKLKRKKKKIKKQEEDDDDKAEAEEKDEEEKGTTTDDELEESDAEIGDGVIIADDAEEECDYDVIRNNKVDDTEIEDELNQVVENIVVEEKEEGKVFPTEVPKALRRTMPVMSKYEFTRLLGERARQLAGGAKPMIKGVENLNSAKIAFLEMQHNVMPLKLRRGLPNNLYEVWEISELNKEELMKQMGESMANV